MRNMKEKLRNMENKSKEIAKDRIERIEKRRDGNKILEENFTNDKTTELCVSSSD